MKTRLTILVLLICGFLVGPARAASDGWQFEVTPYVWAAGIDGDIEVAGRKAEVEVGFEDLIDKVDIAGSFLGVVQKGMWVNWLQVDYLALSNDAKPEGLGGAEIEMESDTLILTAATVIQVGLWSEGQSIDIIGGANRIQTSLL